MEKLNKVQTAPEAIGVEGAAPKQPKSSKAVGLGLRASWTWWSVATVASVVLVWSGGLIGKGIWQLWQSQAAVDQQNIPDRFADVPNVTTGVFAYGGSTAWAPLRLAVDSIIQSERPEMQLRYVQLEVVPPGSSPGIEMLLEGQLAFVQSSRPLMAQEYELARQKRLQLQQVPVAVDGIVVAVHPYLNIPGLTIEQLQKIYTGQITNWQQVGGPNLKITPYSRPLSTGGIVEIFVSEVLRGSRYAADERRSRLELREFGANVEFISTTTEALRQLADNLGGIYYGSAPTILPQCSVKTLPLATQGGEFIAPYQEPVSSYQCPNQRSQLNIRAFRTAQYPLTYYLYVVFLQKEYERSIGQAYANFLLTSQGQEAIAKAGFVPLY